MNREQLIRSIETNKLIVIVRGVSSDAIIPLGEAMYDGGVRLMEITYEADGSKDDVVAASIHEAVKHFGGRMGIGAGTVLSEKQVRLTRHAGGEFIISPNVDEKVIYLTRKLDMVSIPGAYTPTEIQYANQCGADFVKVFPITCLGPEYIHAVTAPLSHIKLLAVGGISETNIGQYLSSGIVGFGVSTNIVNKDLIKRGDWAGLTALAKRYTAQLVCFSN